jgi:pilus assembly protein CpaC
MNAQLAIGAPRLLSPVRATAIFVAVSATVGSVHAQVVQPASARLTDDGVIATAAAAESDTSEVTLLVGRSTLLSVGSNITRVSLTSPNVADAMVTTPSQLLIHGKAPGTISMFVWDRAGGIKRYEVIVRRDLSELVQQVKQLFPGESITVHSNGKDVVISGTVSSKYVIDKAAEVAVGYVEKKEDVVNLLRQQEGIASNQVLLRVRFAEVSRTAMTELGASIFGAGVKDGRWTGRTTTQQFAAPDFEGDRDGNKLVFSDFLNLFLFDAKNSIGGAIRILQNKGLFQSLAEPNLIAENGKEASFLAGGEYPYPVVQGGGDRSTVTIQFKEFGIKLNFTPTIVGADLVKLKVRPEVSSLDFSNAVIFDGFRVPAITTRRTETEVELQDGQTFAIAGLMNNTVTSQMQKIPGIGDIPILGYLFRSKAAQKNQTELVVMITPTILRRGSTGVSPKLPDIMEPYMPPSTKTLPSPAPWNPGAPSAQAAVPAQTPQARPASQPATPRVSAPVVAQAAQPTSQPAKSSTSDRQAVERAMKADAKQREQAARQAEADRKKAAEMARVEAKQSAEDRKKAEKTSREHAKLQAEIDRRTAEAARRQAEVDKRTAEQRAIAQAKLDAARQQYEQQVAKIQAENKPQ